MEASSANSKAGLYSGWWRYTKQDHEEGNQNVPPLNNVGPECTRSPVSVSPLIGE